MPESRAVPTAAFTSALQKTRTDLIRLTNGFPPLGECVPFSPQAYNAISSVILESLYRRIEQINGLPNGVPYYLNLGLLLYCELHCAACSHYFQEYERICGFMDTRPVRGRPVVRRPAFRRSLIHRAAHKIS